MGRKLTLGHLAILFFFVNGCGDSICSHEGVDSWIQGSWKYEGEFPNKDKEIAYLIKFNEGKLVASSDELNSNSEMEYKLRKDTLILNLKIEENSALDTVLVKKKGCDKLKFQGIPIKGHYRKFVPFFLTVQYDRVERNYY